MRMPGIDAAPLAPDLEALRQQVNGLADADHKALMGRLLSDRMRANDLRHAANAERAEREQRARDRDRRASERGQMRLEGAA